jgi:hypothetical protein
MWDEEMKHCVKAIDPLFNRCVVFNTSSNSYHGNPTPVSHPDGKPRLSMALYYYTATWDSTRREHTTKFKTRPASKDQFDWEVTVNEALENLTPPILLRMGRKGWRGISRLIRPH